MSKQSGKSSFLSRIFGHKSHKDQNDERNRAEANFANQSRYYDRQAFGVDENDIQNFNPTAAYHSRKSSKPSRGPRSCHAEMLGSRRYANDSSDSDANHSFHSTFNAAEMSKRHFRRSSKRPKKNMPPVLEDYDEQSSSVASSHVLQNRDMNAQRPVRMVPPNSLPDYYSQASRHYEETRAKMLEQKVLENNQKIKELINKYRREKSRARGLQEQLNEMTRRYLSESEEHQKEIKSLKEEIARLRNYGPPMFNMTNSFQNQFHNTTPQAHIFSNYRNPMTPSMNEFHNIASTRAASETDNDSAFNLKNFRGDEGAPEKMISESSLPRSLQDEPEIARASNEDSFSATTLILEGTVVESDSIPKLSMRDDGYSTCETGSNVNRNVCGRNRRFTTVVPRKIRRTNSWN